jgi:hypothetical protein
MICVPHLTQKKTAFKVAFHPANKELKPSYGQCSSTLSVDNHGPTVRSQAGRLACPRQRIGRTDLSKRTTVKRWGYDRPELV